MVPRFDPLKIGSALEGWRGQKRASLDRRFDPLKIGSALEVSSVSPFASLCFDPLKIGSALEAPWWGLATPLFRFDPLKIGSALEVATTETVVSVVGF